MVKDENTPTQFGGSPYSCLNLLKSKVKLYMYSIYLLFKYIQNIAVHYLKK